MSTDKKLFTNFPPVSREEWEKVIEKDLRGADYKTKLKWHTGEGVDTLPFYRRDDFETLPDPLSADGNDWEVRQSIAEPDIEKANKIAGDAINRGADAISFSLEVEQSSGAIGSDLRGTAIQNQEAFGTLLSGIDISATSLHFEAGTASPVILAMLHNYCVEKDIDTSNVRGSVLNDPYAFAITNGYLSADEEQIVDQQKQAVQFCESNLPGMKCLGVDAVTYHHSGATIVQELGYALATGSEYLGTLSEAGLDIDSIASAIHFKLAIGSNYFLEIAKFRAARTLWHTILDAYDAGDHRAYLHGSTSGWNKTAYDPYVNMLRTTTEGMSAAIAGCDAITVHPFDEPFRQPDDFSRRIARNSQTILKEESYLDKVADPAAGSYYIERLTDKIAEAAWDCFKEIETQGGMLKAIRGGFPQTAIEESRNERDQAIATRGRVFVGINKYPNAEDKSPESQTSKTPASSLNETDTALEFDSADLMASLKNGLQDGAALGDLFQHITESAKMEIRTIRPYRGPEAFEELRRATEKHSKTPVVLTLPMGNKKMRKARSAFASNFFGCIGYDIHDPIGFESTNEAAEAIKNQQPDIVVLCSSDDEYKELVPDLCNTMNEMNNKPIVVLAGYPKEQIENFKKAGVDFFIHAKSNVLETLMEFQQRLNVIN